MFSVKCVIFIAFQIDLLTIRGTVLSNNTTHFVPEYISGSGGHKVDRVCVPTGSYEVVHDEFTVRLHFVGDLKDNVLTSGPAAVEDA